VGSVVARKAGLKIGDEIQPTHGVAPEGHKHEGFKIVGILKPTGTANDRALFINIEGFYLQENHARTDKSHEKADSGAAQHESEDHDEKDEDHNRAHDHDEHEHAPLPIEQREVTSILVLCKNFGELNLEK